ncbi:hypothetical protein ANG2_0251 [Streptococcus constellatus subsp. constellatus SK53]|nr:hypothetical protein ANG2_0251 [Streptococcus constellatus subsp. constellatus SK53]
MGKRKNKAGYKIKIDSSCHIAQRKLPLDKNPIIRDRFMEVTASRTKANRVLKDNHKLIIHIPKE